jgi:hypothetical protein
VWTNGGNENRYPLHSVLREIQETDCGDLADLTPLGQKIEAVERRGLSLSGVSSSGSRGSAIGMMLSFPKI